MSYYYEEGRYSKANRFPWGIMLVVMLIAAIAGGLFSYYLLNDKIDSRLAELQRPIQAVSSTQGANGDTTVVNNTQMLLSGEAMQTLLNNTGSSSVIDLIYGEIANIYEKVSPSIVGISNIVKYTSYYNTFGFGSRNNNEQEVEQSSGSGVIYSSDGYIVTNYHVIEKADRLVVALADGSTEEATVIGYDARTDLALLKINRSNLTAANFGSSATLRVGDYAMAIGNPGGETFSRSQTCGTISGLDRIVSTSEGLQLSMIQTDAAINPGNSGGALVNSKGEVIGINTVKISSTAYEGMGFAIPVNTMQEIVAQLKEYHKVLRPALGVHMLRDLDSAFASYNKLSVSQGVLVSPTEKGGAAKAGIENYDIITAIDGEAITSSTELQNKVFSYNIGDTVTVTVYRYTLDKSFDVKVVLGEME